MERKWGHYALSTLVFVIFELYMVHSLKLTDPRLLVLLVPLLIIIEWFPLRIKGLHVSVVFPILYTLSLVNGYALTGFVSVVVLLFVLMLKHSSLYRIVQVTSSRLFCLLGASLSTHLYMNLHLFESTPFLHILFNLCAALFGYIAATIVITRLFEGSVAPKARSRLFLNNAVHGLISLVYDVFMLWLASNPKNVQSGALGTMFFFLPLTILTIVMHLLANLSSANSKLESLFAVSQSINEQSTLKGIFHQIVVESCTLVAGDRGQFFMPVPNTNQLKLEIDSTNVGTSKSVTIDSGPVWHILHNRKPVLIHDIKRTQRQGEDSHLEIGTDMNSLMLIPIPIDESLTGILAIGHHEKYTFGNFHLHLMTILATHASVAIKNTMYIEEREKRLVAEERNRLAREIHDGIAQDLAGAVLQIEMMKRIQYHPLGNAIDTLQRSLKDTIAKVRQSIYSLRPQPYAHIGLLPAIRSHLDEIRSQHDIEIELHHEEFPESLPPAIGEAVYQVLQESIRNAIKHANATAIYISLQRDRGSITLTITDNGSGFNFGKAILRAGKNRSFGIENMHSLASRVDGTLDFDTAPGEGTTVKFDVHLEEVTTNADTRTAL